MIEDKKRWVDSLRERLSRELQTMTRLAADAAAAATHEENRPEGDKDMRSTEASYIAKGQADRVRSIEQSLAALAAMPILSFGPLDTIAISAYVEVVDRSVTRAYFLVPTTGGERLVEGAIAVDTLATTSPLGRALLGLSVGDEATVKTPQGERTLEIVTVR